MPLTEVQAPEQLVRSFLDRIGIKTDDKPRLLIPLPVYVIGDRSIAAGKVAPDAKQIGWQFLSIDPHGVRVSGDAANPATDKKLAFASRSQGSWVNNAFEVYRAATDFEQLRNSLYEARALRIPSLHIEVFWLRKMPEQPKTDQRETDFVVPFRTYDQELAEHRILTMQQFLRIAQPLAQRQREFARHEA